MKQFLFSFIILLASINSRSQNKQSGINLELVTTSISLEAGQPIGNMSARGKGSGIGAGAAFHMGYPLRDRINFIATAGYMRFTSKGKNSNGSNYIFYLVGVQYKIKPPIHIDASIGYAAFKGIASNPFFPNGIAYNNKGIAFNVKAGYQLTKKLDGSVKIQKSNTVFFIGAGLALALSN